MLHWWIIGGWHGHVWAVWRHLCTTRDAIVRPKPASDRPMHGRGTRVLGHKARAPGGKSGRGREGPRISVWPVGRMT